MNNNEFKNENEVVKEGISFSEILFLIKRNILMIIIVTLVFTGVGFVYGKFFCKPTYTATTTAVVQVENSSISEYNAFVYSQYLVNSMAEFIVSDSVTKEVAKAVINEKYLMTPVLDENDKIIGYYSETENRNYSLGQYDSLVLKKKDVIQSGAKVSTSTESLLIKISYSCVEEDETTEDEVIKIVDLLVLKTKEVAAQEKEVIKYGTIDPIQAVYAVKEAYINVYGLEEKKIGDTTVYQNSDGSISYNNSDFEVFGMALRNYYTIYYDGTSVVIARNIKKGDEPLDRQILYYCLEYLTKYVQEHPIEVPSTEFMYPTFANKLVEMNDVVYATVSTKTLLVSVIAFILGIIVSCGIILVKYIMDDTFTSKDEIERLTGANVLTYIDKFDVKEAK